MSSDAAVAVAIFAVVVASGLAALAGALLVPDALVVNAIVNVAVSRARPAPDRVRFRRDQTATVPASSST